MILDKQNLFSEDQAITVTANSTNIIDLGADSSRVQDLNEKGVTQAYFQVTTAFAGGTSIVVTLTESDSSTMLSETTVVASATVALATLVAGYQFQFSTLPLISKRYLRSTYTVVGTMSAGNIMAGLALDRQSNV